MEAGVRMAEELIDSGAALKKLDSVMGGLSFLYFIKESSRQNGVALSLIHI